MALPKNNVLNVFFFGDETLLAGAPVPNSYK